MWHQQPHVSFEPSPNCLTKSYESALMQKDQLKCMNWE